MSGNAISFRSKIFTSVKLSSLKFLSEIGLRFASTVVLTRLLDPDTYGVFAIVLVYLYLLEMISDIGLRTLLVTKEGEVDDDFLRSFWTVSILRGVVIAVFSVVIAAIIGVLQAQGVFAADNPYAAASLPWAIVVLGLSNLIVGFHSPMRFVCERNMQFGKVTAMAIAVNVFGLVVTIALAFYLRSVWALVLGAVCKNLFQVFLSFAIFSGPPMRLNFNRAHLGIMIGRGKWIMGHSTLTALSQSADRLMLGFVMTASSFGFYFIARQLSDMVLRFLISIDAQIGLQVFRHLHESSEADFRRNYYRFRLFFDALAGLSAGGLIMLAPLLVEIIFDDRYAGVAPIVQVLALAVLLMGPLLLRSAYYAERRFKEMTFQSVLSTVTLWVGLSIAIFWFDSITGAFYVIALHRLPEALVFTVMGWQRGWVVIWREFLGLGFCALGAAIGWGVLWLWTALA